MTSWTGTLRVAFKTGTKASIITQLQSEQGLPNAGDPDLRQEGEGDWVQWGSPCHTSPTPWITADARVLDPWERSVCVSQG